MPSLTWFHKRYIQIDLKAFHMKFGNKYHSTFYRMTLFHILHIEILPFCGFNCDCLVPDHVAAFSSQVLKCKSLAA